MSAETIKALQLSHLENELLDIIKTIRMHEAILNSHKTFHKQKENSKKELLKLVRVKMSLVDQITEASLLHEIQ